MRNFQKNPSLTVEPKQLKNHPPAQLLKVASRYYEDGKGLLEIGTEIGTSRATVARMIKEAHSQGIVKILIVPPGNLNELHQLEEELCRKFSCLNDAVVIKGGEKFDGGTNSATRDGVLFSLVETAGNYISQQLNNDDVVVVSPGQQVKSSIKYIRVPKRLPQLRIVPMIGYASERYFPTAAPANGVDLQIATEGQFFWLPMPAFVDEGQEKIARELPVARTAMKVMDEASLVIMGIGRFTKNKRDGMVRSGFVTEDGMNSFFSKSVNNPPIGEIAGQPFSIYGDAIKTSWRTIGFGLTGTPSLQDLVVSGRGRVIAIAGVDEERLEPILGALRGKFMNTLITDSLTAKWLIDNA